MKIKEKMNFKDMRSSKDSPITSSLKYYLQICRAEISVFALVTKFKAIKHFEFHCCIKGIKKWGNENNPLLLMFIRFTKTVHFFKKKALT